MASTPASVEAAHLFERLERLSRTADGAPALNPAQWDALRFLERANRFSRTPAAVAEYLGATRGTVSQTLIALEQRRLIARQPNPRDARSLRVDLTEAGRASLQGDPLQTLAAALGGASPSDLAAMLTVLRAALQHALARNGGRAFGQCATCRHFRQGEGPSAEMPYRCGLLDEPLSEADAGFICAEHAA